MMMRKWWLSGALALASTFSMASEPADVRMKMDWQEIAPAPEAVARPFAGLVKDGDATKLLVAGGSLHDGTNKTYSKTISVYDPKANTWTKLGELPQGIAEGGAVVVEDGLLCVGGIADGKPTNAAFLLKPNGTIEPLPPLTGAPNPISETPTEPQAAVTALADAATDGTVYETAAEPLPDTCVPLTLSMTAAANWGTGAVFAGGYVNGIPSNRVFSLQKKDKAWTWTELAPFPGDPRVQAVAATQNGDQKTPVLAVYGGSAVDANGVQYAAKDGYGYAKDFDGKEVWTKLEDVPVSTIGATFTPIGDQHILLVGGYNAEIWDAVMQGAPRPADCKWNRDVYAYHAVTGKWVKYGEIAEGIAPRCGAAAVVLPAEFKGNSSPRLVVVGGEDAPAHRTTAGSIVHFTRDNWAFSWLSWTVIGVYFLAMVGMAMFFIMRQKTADSYFRGGKSIPWYVAGMSIFATMLSSITFISIPTMTYIGDWRYFPMVVCIFILAPIAIYFYLPFFCRLNITSAYEYLEKRFNIAIRLFGSGVFNIFMVCRVAVVVLLPALALDAVTGIGVENCILICGVLTIIYCCLGGLDAVIWSDFFQGIVLLGGAIAVMLILIYKTDGGFGGFMEIANDHEKLRILDFRFLLSEPVFWVVVIQGLVSNLSSYTSDQCVIQRYIACTNEKKAAQSIWFNGALSVIASVIFYTIGTALYTHYFSSPELMDVTMPKSDSVFPIFMAMELHPIISGLVIAAIFAATISTLSANLTSASTAITTDFVLRFKPKMTGQQQIKCGRICIIIVGILGVAAALTLAQLPTRSLFDEFQKFIAMLTAGLTALFFMGIFMPRVGGGPAVVGLIANYIVCYGLDLIPAASSLAKYKPHPFVYGGIGLVVCILIAWILSIFWKNERSTEGLTHFSKPEGSPEE